MKPIYHAIICFILTSFIWIYALTKDTLTGLLLLAWAMILNVGLYFLIKKADEYENANCDKGEQNE